jgi:hypothetical protein
MDVSKYDITAVADDEGLCKSGNWQVVGPCAVCGRELCQGLGGYARPVLLERLEAGAFVCPDCEGKCALPSRLQL